MNENKKSKQPSQKELNEHYKDEIHAVPEEGFNLEIKKTAKIVDEEEGINADFHGARAYKMGKEYYSKEKGEVCVPLRTEDGSFIAAPKSRLKDCSTKKSFRTSYPGGSYERIFGKRKKRSKK